MPYALLSILQPGHSEREFEVAEDVVSIGRADDNTICLEDDTNVSRYHAEIEKRDDAFFLLDLGSSNGTTVNDLPVEFERRLRDADVISLGGSTVIEFRQSDIPFRRDVQEAKVADTPAVQPLEVQSPATGSALPPVPSLSSAAAGIQPPPVAVPAPGGSPLLLIIGGVAGGLILTTLVALLIIGIMSRNSCSSSIHIASPQNGTTLRGPTPVRLEVKGAECIERVIYQIDGVEVARAETSPYEIVLDPSQLRSVGSGNHTLSLSIEDNEGAVRVEETLLLAIETTGTSLPTPSDSDGQSTPDQTPTVATDASVDVRSLSDRLAGQISRKSGYVFDRDFVELIRSRSSEYRVGGYSERARRYRREINKAFRDQGLDPLLGYLLAMSRSKFNENLRGEGVGLWQIPVSVAQAQGYLTAGESEETLKDPKRSAEIAAVYTKALVSTFESTDDFMFAVACFGLPLSQAGQVRTQLATQAPDPLARRDFLKMVKLGVVKGDHLDRVVRFFAAGIVAENPQAFGLQSDSPFSSLF